jgi:hypothetical protein
MHLRRHRRLRARQRLSPALGQRRAASTEASIAQAEELCRQYIERRVAGVFFQPWESMPNYEEANFRLVEQLHRAGLPIVLLDRDLVPFPQRTEFDLVEVDNFADPVAPTDVRKALVGGLIRSGARVWRSQH